MSQSGGLFLRRAFSDTRLYHAPYSIHLLGLLQSTLFFSFPICLSDRYVTAPGVILWPPTFEDSPVPHRSLRSGHILFSATLSRANVKLWIVSNLFFWQT